MLIKFLSRVFFLLQYEAQLSRLKAEQTIVQDQMIRDRVTVERLETLLDQTRQESINAQANNQELQNEISRLKQRLSELQSKLYVWLRYFLYCLFFTTSFYIHFLIITDRQNPRSSESIRIKRRNIISKSPSSVDKLPTRDSIAQEGKKRLAGISLQQPKLRTYIYSFSRVFPHDLWSLVHHCPFSNPRDSQEPTVLLHAKSFQDRTISPHPSDIRSSNDKNTSSNASMSR